MAQDRELLTPTMTAGEEQSTAFGETVAQLVDEPDDKPASLAHGAERFAISHELGRGGMGVVYEANDTQFGRSVALKMLRRPQGALRARFLTESVITANLEHPGVAPVYERGFDERGAPFYAMRLVRGRTLSDEVSARDNLERRLELIPVVVRVAQTLAFAHDRGVVHRDVKPDNVMIGKHGDTVLLDWGIARLRGMPAISTGDEASGAVHGTGTRAGAIVGTPAYMAPEQARGDSDAVDERTDVFALGALLYHVLTGRPPFKAEPGTDPLAHAREGAAPPLHKLEPKAPPALVAIVQRAMSPDPSARHQTAGEVAGALEAFIGQALRGGESRAVTLYAAAIAVLSLLVTAGSTYMVTSNMPSLAERGGPAIAYTFLFIAGLSLSVIEWRTRGRYHLSRLSFAFALLVLLLGFAGTFDGYTYVLRGSEQVNMAGDMDKLRAVMIAGTYEAFGNLAPSANFAAMQILAWALVSRANTRARAREKA